MFGGTRYMDARLEFPHGLQVWVKSSNGECHVFVQLFWFCLNSSAEEERWSHVRINMQFMLRITGKERPEVRHHR